MRDCFDLPHIRQALASLPKNLDDTYARILCHIDNRYNHYSRFVLKTLQWLTFSTRPLLLEELAETFAIDVDETPRFDPERRLPEPREILTICSSLITLTNYKYNIPDEESGSEAYHDWHANNEEDSKTYVRLAHFSVQEYLVSERIQHGTAPHYNIRAIESNRVLAEDCLAYLLQFDEPGSLTYETLGNSPLALYAARYWVVHAKRAEQGPSKSATLLSMKLFMTDGEGFLNWIRICDIDRVRDEADLSRGANALASPIYYASRAGLCEAVRLLIEAGMDINAQGGRRGNALQAASAWGHVDVVNLPLDNGADVNAMGGVLGGALHAASWNGYEKVVKMLLDKGAVVNVMDEYWGSALQLASRKGYENVVKILLDKGADVDAMGSRGSALQLASMLGHEKVVEMLLDKGADVNTMGPGGSALQLASCRGYEKVVDMLLDKGADMSAMGSRGSALQLVSEKGHEKIVKVLLNNGTDVNVMGPRGSALQLASRKGHENVVEILLDKGADVNAVDMFGKSALKMASEKGHKKVVEILVANGAVMPEKGSDHGWKTDASTE